MNEEMERRIDARNKIRNKRMGVTPEESEFIEARKAALKVAEWENKNEPEYQKLIKNVCDADEEIANALKRVEAKREFRETTENDRITYLEQSIPESLRKLEKK